MALFTMHRMVSPMPIGHTPGCLSSAITRHATKAEILSGSTYCEQSFLAIEAIAEHRSVEEEL